MSRSAAPVILLACLFLAATGAALAAGLVPPERAVDDDQARLALARELAWRNGPGDMAEARALLQGLLERQPDNSPVLEALADMEAARGHYATARDMSLRAEAAAPGDAALALRTAERMLLWGETGRAVRRWRSNLDRNPDDPRTLLGLARSLGAGQRLHEAEAVARLAVQASAAHPVLHRDALHLLADVLLDAKRPLEALAMAGTLAATGDRRADGLRGKALLDAGRPREAMDAFEADGDMATAARSALAAGDAETALEYADLALALDPTDPEARLLAAGDDPDRAQAVAEQTLAASHDPGLMARWGDALARRGMFRAAASAYRAALDSDPGHFPARMSLAEVLAASGEHGPALAELDVLSRDLPQSDKIALTRARVLSWAQRYDESLDDYAALAERDQGNPVPRREAARVAYWDKRSDLGDDLYQAATEAAEARAREALARDVALERRAKRQAFEGRFVRAMQALEELARAEPGNEEGLFDLAQAQCALGLCDREADTYRRLLAVDPLHSLATDALDRQEIRASPELSAGWWFWDEQGRGDLADITRRRLDLTAEIPLDCRHRLRLVQHHWAEEPGNGFTARQAQGQTLEGRAVVDEHFAMAASVTRKDFDVRDIPDTTSWRLEAEANADDLVRLGLRLSRRDEIANGFALGRGLQSDHLRLDAASRPVRRLELTAGAEGIRYNDHNQGRLADASAGWTFTDHPRTLELVASAEARDTAEESGYHYKGEDLTDITHPYWTPQDYLAGGLTLVWNHDLSKEQYCGAMRHFYEIRVGLGTDSEHNPSGRVEASWLLEFAERWSVRAEALVHESEEWDARALSMTLGRRF